MLAAKVSGTRWGLGVLSKSGAASLLANAIGMLLLHPPDAGATVSACPAAATLEQLMACLVDSDHMPRSGSNGFSVPNASERIDWNQTVKDMLDGSRSGTCTAIPLPVGLTSLYEITLFSDTSAGRSYSGKDLGNSPSGRAAKSRAVGSKHGPMDPELRYLVERWDDLPAPVKAGILAIGWRKLNRP